MRRTFLVVTVKKWLKSVYIYGSYRKIKTGLSLFWTTLYIIKRFRVKCLNCRPFSSDYRAYICKMLLFNQFLSTLLLVGGVA